MKNNLATEIINQGVVDGLFIGKDKDIKQKCQIFANTIKKITGADPGIFLDILVIGGLRKRNVRIDEVTFYPDDPEKDGLAHTLLICRATNEAK